ncbi:TPA: hypothetical protein DF272_04490 [Candidatus Falkowbacteria bacterium]|nr:hypothetical protein [Candidatus Falkowbacteria bacterium]
MDQPTVVTARSYNAFATKAQEQIEGVYRQLLQRLWDSIPFELYGYRDLVLAPFRKKFFTFISMLFDRVNGRPFVYMCLSKDVADWGFFSFDQLAGAFELLKTQWSDSVKVEIKRANIGSEVESMSVEFSILV